MKKTFFKDRPAKTGLDRGPEEFFMEWFWPFVFAFCTVGLTIYLFKSIIQEIESSNTNNVWSNLKSYYFVIVTLTTIGYGDFACETYEGRIATIFLIFISAIFLFAIFGYIFLSLIQGPPFLLLAIIRKRCNSWRVSSTIDVFESNVSWGILTRLDEEIIDNNQTLKNKKRDFTRKMFVSPIDDLLDYPSIINDDFQNYRYIRKDYFVSWLDITFNNGNGKFKDILYDENEKNDDICCCCSCLPDVCWNQRCRDIWSWIWVLGIFMSLWIGWMNQFVDEETLSGDRIDETFGDFNSFYFGVVTSASVGYGDYKALGNDFGDWDDELIKFLTYYELPFRVLFLLFVGITSKLLLNYCYQCSYQCCCSDCKYNYCAFCTSLYNRRLFYQYATLTMLFDRIRIEPTPDDENISQSYHKRRDCNCNCKKKRNLDDSNNSQHSNLPKRSSSITINAGSLSHQEDSIHSRSRSVGQSGAGNTTNRKNANKNKRKSKGKSGNANLSGDSDHDVDLSTSKSGSNYKNHDAGGARSQKNINSGGASHGRDNNGDAMELALPSAKKKQRSQRKSKGKSTKSQRGLSKKKLPSNAKIIQRQDSTDV